MKKLIAIAIALIPLVATSATLQKEAVVCTNKEKLGQMRKAAADNDMRGIRYLLDNGCLMTAEPMQISVLDNRLNGASKVRVYTDTGALEVWTTHDRID